ncbi:hypothetical protein V5N11_027422 [Cardamine amara subsp. amara]|uniref:SWIM-type domain-containing protein n=1 Tax=Cardamine amara subsp. amara TaxID=228776 RepID=A0ABD1C617_CARAN
MKNPECARYLEKIAMAHWTKVYFRGMRYNLMTSNIAESLNKALKGCRSSHIVELLKFIRSMMTRWFNAQRKKSLKHRRQMSLEVDKEMTRRRNAVDGSRVGSVSNWSIEIVGKFNGKHHVLLNKKKCNCRQYDKVQIPCGHAMLAADSIALSYQNLVGN